MQHHPVWRSALFCLALAALLAIPDQAQTVATLTAVRDLRIDGAAQEFADINWILVGRDGSIAVPQAAESRIRFFDATGRPAGSFGRKGSGPNELLGIGRAGWAGDTLWLLDPENARVLFVHPDHKQSHTAPMRFAAALPGGTPATAFLDIAIAYYRDGDRLVLGHANPRLAAPSWVPASATILDRLFVLVSSRGKVIRLTGWYHSPDCRDVLPQACQTFAWNVAADGGRLLTSAVVRENAGAVTWRIVNLGEHGDTIFARDYTTPRVPITKRWADSVVRFVDSVTRKASAGRASAPPRTWRIPAANPCWIEAVARYDGTKALDSRIDRMVAPSAGSP